MDIQSIVTAVGETTQHRADQKLDLRVQLFLAIDELCIDRHFWWRQKKATVQLVVSQTTPYDLSTIAPDFTEFDDVWLVDSSGTKLSENPLTALFDRASQLAASLNPTADIPSAYFLDTSFTANPLQNIAFQAPSSVAQKVLISYWAMAMVKDPGSNTEDVPVPLVPPFLHWGLIYALERRVFKFLYGANDPRYGIANANYEDFKVKASRIPNWATGQVTEVRVRDSRLGVQAHR